jgi:hypothetical protein
MSRIVIFLAMYVLFIPRLYSQSEPVICVVSGDFKSCADLNPNARTWYCMHGLPCNNGLCPGNQYEQRPNQDWHTPKRTAREAGFGEAGAWAQLGARVCLAKRPCICNYDPVLGYQVCNLSLSESDTVVVSSFEFEIVPPQGLQPCVGAPPPAGGGPGGGGRGN